jgi:hypothetical protein
MTGPTKFLVDALVVRVKATTTLVFSDDPRKPPIREPLAIVGIVRNEKETLSNIIPSDWSITALPATHGWTNIFPPLPETTVPRSLRNTAIQSLRTGHALQGGYAEGRKSCLRI